MEHIQATEPEFEATPKKWKHIFIKIASIFGLLLFILFLAREKDHSGSSILGADMNEAKNEAPVIIQAYMKEALKYPDSDVSKGFNQFNTTHNIYTGKFSGYSVVHYYLTRVPQDGIPIRYEYSQKFFLDSNPNITYVERPMVVSGPFPY